ncbi:MAG: glycoside hydrolase family 16 protein [Bacteroidota bacterium]
MKKNILFVLLLFSLKQQAQILWQINKDTVITWYYFDGDDFTDPTINIKKWDYWYGWTRNIFSHKEQQYYTDGTNHEIKNGSLNLFAKRERIEKKTVDWLTNSDSIFNGKNYVGPNKRIFKYTSGMIQSKTKYKYGFFEIKFKMPEDNGYWPAFWLQGGFPNEEIDWMELKTDKKNAVHVGRHSQKKEENYVRKIFRKRPWGGWVYFKGNLSKNWNIISGEWTPQYLKYYLNGECIAYTDVPLNIEKTICINLAVPGNDGPFHPGPDTNVIRSGNFEIDYIRVWKKDKNTALSIINPGNNNSMLGDTKLRTKGRFLYSKRKNHKNEGIFVALIPIEEDKYQLQVSGKKIPKDAFYTITNSETKKLICKELKYGFTIIDLENLKDNNLQLEIHYLNQKIKYPLRTN